MSVTVDVLLLLILLQGVFASCLRFLLPCRRPTPTGTTLFLVPETIIQQYYYASSWVEITRGKESGVVPGSGLLILVTCYSTPRGCQNWQLDPDGMVVVAGMLAAIRVRGQKELGDWPQLSASCVKCRDLVFLSPWSGQVRRFGAGPPASRGFPNRASCASLRDAPEM